VAEALALAKEFSSAESQLEHSKKMLTNQGIMPSVFCGAVHIALSKGQGKFLQ